MHEARLEISKSNQSSVLVIGTGKYHYWRLESALSWWPGGSSGSWVRVTNATKFRQFSYLELVDGARRGVARLKEQPYKQAETFTGSLVQKHWIFETAGESFDVRVQSCPPSTKSKSIGSSNGSCNGLRSRTGTILG